MKKRKKIASKEIGLEVGLILSSFLLKTEYLHFGYWTPDLKVDIVNLPKAQENHMNLIISNIPEGTKSILDVGCGSGKVAQTLIAKGYEVDCVSPSSVLTDHARQLLGNKSHIYECYYQQMQTDKRYDLILFSESFQYIPIENALQNSLKFLKDQGHILICDFFRTDMESKYSPGGGHKLSKFIEIISQYPLTLLTEIDITKETAPNFDIYEDFITKVAHPIVNLLLYYLDHNYPVIAKFIRWKGRKKIEKMQKRFFSGEVSSERFVANQTYRLLLYKK